MGNTLTSVPRLLNHYRQMLQIRAFEETAIRGLEAGEAHGALHPYIGQEAIAVGVLAHTQDDDLALSTHRGHGHSLAKGADPVSMMKELFGREGGTSGGRGGSMHIADFSVGMLGANGVVAANIVIAAGAAHAVHMQGDDRIVVCFIGDGAVNRGPFIEGLNWAATFQLPVLFVCEDNQISASTATGNMTAGAGPVARAESLGLRVATVDGNDVESVFATSGQLIGEIRSGTGPAFLHASTYRLLGHTSTDPALHRDQAVVHTAWENEPISQARRALLERGIEEEELVRIEDCAQRDMDQVYERSVAAPFPEPREAFREVQTVGNPEKDAF